MKVSIIIPSSRFDFIEETLTSLENQTVQPFEILYQYSPDINPSDKINNLVSIAKGDAVVVLCDDDNLDPKFIEKTTKIMDGSEYDIVYTDMQKFGLESFIQPAAEYTETNFKLSTVPWITSLIRKTVFDEIGGWDPEQTYADYDFYYRAFKAGIPGYCIHEPLFHYRVHNKAGSFHMDHKEARAKMKDKHPEIR